MDWKKIYKERVCTAEEAVKLIKPEDKVVFAHAVAEPPALVEAMMKNAEAYKDVEVCHMVTLGKGEYTKAEYKGNFKFNGWFCSPSTRDSISEGHGDFTPVFFHEVPSFIRKGLFPVDVCLVMVSPPDDHGFAA